MTFSIYALLGNEAPAITNESLGDDLRHFFRNEEGFSIQFEQLPFAKNKSLALRWDKWLVRVSYEDGDKVAQDTADIGKVVSCLAPFDLSSISRRIRLVFSDDDLQEYTNQFIYLMDFLREIPGVAIFDPQQSDFIK
ncbi:hypothetical protein [Chitinimonas sp. BJB300]|uniref:hypothetical protein n=1 Tax=Chitinimonas sp. BJB300 TaxID=1559339 RepID=UPI000C0F54E6|nr:hypothetical protein [Chitinimonas sp. BJB300]PHV09952.1 hypothetical protein CSQ89_18855 [Chitinimonas sp. BJB300]TSJ82863.1 hypothetical protein FG002_021935 [Chitinimonas sp. BJB300]